MHYIATIKSSVNFFYSSKHLPRVSFPIDSPLRMQHNYCPIILGSRSDVVRSSVYGAPASRMFPEKGGKRAVGISTLIMRPSHLLKKLLPAAVKESRTSLCSSSSMEQLRLSIREMFTLWTFALSLPCLHPTTQLPNNGACGSLRLGSEQTSEAGLQTNHCGRAERQAFALFH